MQNNVYFFICSLSDPLLSLHPSLVHNLVMCCCVPTSCSLWHSWNLTHSWVCTEVFCTLVYVICMLLYVKVGSTSLAFGKEKFVMLLQKQECSHLFYSHTHTGSLQLSLLICSCHDGIKWFSQPQYAKSWGNSKTVLKEKTSVIFYRHPLLEITFCVCLQSSIAIAIRGKLLSQSGSLWQKKTVLPKLLRNVTSLWDPKTIIHHDSGSGCGINICIHIMNPLLFCN